MEVYQKLALDSTMAITSEVLEPMDIINDLISDGVMTWDDLEKLQAATTRQDRVRFFIKTLHRRGSGAFEIFLQRLTKHTYYSELVKNLRTHGNCYKGPTPLCIPSNWSYSGGVLACKDASHRGDLSLCKEGLDVLRSIGDYPVVPISITGPTRSGKSSLMSRLVEGLKFEVGDSLESKTTGIWIALNPRPVVIEGVETRVVLLDSEGTDSVIKAERDIQDSWDMKVFAVCYFLSSHMIYNSSNMPNKSDLQRLHFIAEFSDSAFGATNDNSSKNMFSGCTPSFMWLFRNVTLKVKNNDWKTYLEEKVFFKGDSSSDDTYCVRNAIYKLFSSFDAAALPAPSTDPDVCADLDNEENRQIVEKFVNETEKVKCKVYSNAGIKKLCGKPITGKDLADLLEIYISQVNKNGNGLLTGNLWNNTLSLWTQKILDTSRETLRSRCNDIKLPCNSKILEKRLADIENELRISFNQSYKPSKTNEDQKSFEKLEYIINIQKLDIINKNEDLSETVCKDIAISIVQKHYNSNAPESSQHDIETQIQFLETLRTNMDKMFYKQTEGFPKAGEIFTASVADLDEEIETLKDIQMVKSIASDVRLSMEQIVPCTKEELKDKQKSFWDEKYALNDILPKLNKLERAGFEILLNKEFSELLQLMSAFNDARSYEECHALIKKLISGLHGQGHESERIKSMDEMYKEYKEHARGPCADQVYLENKRRLKKAQKKAKAAQRCNFKWWIRKLCLEM